MGRRPVRLIRLRLQVWAAQLRRSKGAVLDIRLTANYIEMFARAYNFATLGSASFAGQGITHRPV